MVSLTKRMTHGCSDLHSVRQTNKRCTERYHHPHPRVQQRMEACGSRVRVYRITRSHNCAPSLPIPCDPISSCITQAVWKR